MNRKTAVAFLVFVVVGSLSWYVLSRPKKGQRQGERERPIAKLDPKQIKEITLAAKGNQTTLVRQGEANDEWKLTKPVDYPADTYATKTMLEKLEKLEFGDLVSEQKAKHAELEVDDKSGVLVKVSDGSKELVSFYLGKIVDGHTMFRASGSDAVYQVVGSLRHAFDKELKFWRNRSVLSFKQDDARKISVNGRDGEIVFSRKDKDADWKVENSATPIDALDKSAVSSLLSSLSSLSASDFADGATLDKTGLNQPRATVTVALQQGKALTVQLGNNEGDDYWINIAGSAQVYLIKKYTAENLIKRPIDFRDKTMLTFNSDDAMSLTLTRIENGKKVRTALARKGDKWHKNGTALGDASKVTAAITSLAALKCDRFARHSTTEFGLNKPEWTVEIKLKDGTTHRLSVGPKEFDGFYGVARKGVSDVFALRKYQLDKFLLKADDLK